MAGFARLSSLSDLYLNGCCEELVGTEETYAVLSQIPTLTNLDLSESPIEALPEGDPECFCLELTVVIVLILRLADLAA